MRVARQQSRAMTPALSVLGLRRTGVHCVPARRNLTMLPEKQVAKIIADLIERGLVVERITTFRKAG